MWQKVQQKVPRKLKSQVRGGKPSREALAPCLHQCFFSQTSTQKGTSLPSAYISIVFIDLIMFVLHPALSFPSFPYPQFLLPPPYLSPYPLIPSSISLQEKVAVRLRTSPCIKAGEE